MQLSQNKDIRIGFLFDLDGVLIDSEQRYTRLWQGIEQLYPTGIPNFPKVIKGNTLHELLDRYYPNNEIRGKVHDMCIEFEKHMKVEWMPGAVNLLHELKKRDIPRALVTSSDKPKMSHLRQILPDLEGWFNAIIDGDMVKHGKPDPEPYLSAAGEIGVSPVHCAVVEDAINGLMAGRDAGAFLIGMSDTLGREAITPYSDMVLDSLEQIDLPEITEILRFRN